MIDIKRFIDLFFYIIAFGLGHIKRHRRVSKIFRKLKKLMFIKSIKLIQFIMKNLHLKNVRLQVRLV